MRCVLASVGLLFIYPAIAPSPSFAEDDDQVPSELYVDPQKGRDNEPSAGSFEKPFRSISAAIAVIPEEVRTPITIHLLPGRYDTTGGHGMPDNHLVLRRRTASGCYIQLKGAGGGKVNARPVLLDWISAPMVTVCEGRWRIGHIQLGTRNKKQRQGSWPRDQKPSWILSTFEFERQAIQEVGYTQNEPEGSTYTGPSNSTRICMTNARIRRRFAESWLPIMAG